MCQIQSEPIETFTLFDVFKKIILQSYNRKEKYTFELKWFIPVEDIIILEESTANPHEVPSSSIVALKSQASNTRDQLRQEEKALEEKVILTFFAIQSHTLGSHFIL